MLIDFQKGRTRIFLYFSHSFASEVLVRQQVVSVLWSWEYGLLLAGPAWLGRHWDAGAAVFWHPGLGFMGVERLLLKQLPDPESVR